MSPGGIDRITTCLGSAPKETVYPRVYVVRNPSEKAVYVNPTQTAKAMEASDIGGVSSDKIPQDDDGHTVPHRSPRAHDVVIRWKILCLIADILHAEFHGGTPILEEVYWETRRSFEAKYELKGRSVML